MLAILLKMSFYPSPPPSHLYPTQNCGLPSFLSVQQLLQLCKYTLLSTILLIIVTQSLMAEVSYMERVIVLKACKLAKNVHVFPI